MGSMFARCINLITLDISHFDTSNVTDMEEMFNDCSFLEEIDISSFSFSNDEVIDGMFNNCVHLRRVYINNNIKDRVTDEIENAMITHIESEKSARLNLFSIDKIENTNDDKLVIHISLLSSTRLLL